MKKIITLTIALFTALSLTFAFPISVNAERKVSLTYYAGKGYFKAANNRNKRKITIKHKINKKRGYAPAVKRNGYAFNGWYTRKKGGIKYFPSKKITQKKKLYAHWLKKYHLNTNYFIPVGMTYYSLSDYESYWGKLEIVKSKKHTDNYDYTLKNSKGDIFYVGTGVVSIDSNYTFTYNYKFSDMDCKLKNLINIKKPTNFKKFLKKLGVKYYNYDSSDKYLDFVCGKTHFPKDTYDTDMVWIIYLNEKNQVTPDTVVSFDPNDEWEHY